MIISRTPFRISFFGGGTDYPSWYERHGGAVLATTIDKYCYLTCRYLPPFFEHKFRVVYSRAENARTLDEIGHPSVRETIRHLGVTRGLEIHHDADLPARSGMGSSSAFTVGLLHALSALGGEMRSKHQLATESIHIEQHIIRETVGSQDQVMAAHGGLNHVVFTTAGEVSVRPVTIPRDRVRELNDHLMLFYTGIKRTASEVAGSYVNDFEGHRRQLRIMKDLVEEGLSILTGRHHIAAFGELLREAWQAKRSLGAAISNPQVEDMFARAAASGATGGKITGAGGGGFLLLFVPPDRQGAVRQSLSDLIPVPFKFEFGGSQIIFFDREEEYLNEELAQAGLPIAAFRELADPPPSLRGAMMGMEGRS